MVRILVLLLCLPGGAARALELEGEPVQGGILRGEVTPNAELELNGEPVPVADSGHFVLGFGRNADLRQVLAWKTPAGETKRRVLALKERRYDIQRVDGVPQKTVSPPPEALERIRKEARQVREARARLSALEYFAQDFIWPAQGPVTGVYGSQRIYNGEPGRPHYGIDIAGPKGARVVAPAPGRVVLAHPDMYFSGGTLIIDHGHGLTSTMIHLSEILVKVGTEVEQGQPVARIGAGGRATGAHLDWRMNWQDVRVDPATIAPPLRDGKAWLPDEVPE